MQVLTTLKKMREVCTTTSTLPHSKQVGKTESLMGKTVCPYLKNNNYSKRIIKIIYVITHKKEIFYNFFTPV